MKTRKFNEEKRNAEECLKDVMANEVKHTPTPWRVAATWAQTSIVDTARKGAWIEIAKAHLPEDASLIVNAVNNRAELLKALKIAQDILKRYHEECGDCDHSVNICNCDILKAREYIEQVMVKAEGK